MAFKPFQRQFYSPPKATNIGIPGSWYLFVQQTKKHLALLGGLLGELFRRNGKEKTLLVCCIIVSESQFSRYKVIQRTVKSHQQFWVVDSGKLELHTKALSSLPKRSKKCKGTSLVRADAELVQNWHTIQIANWASPSLVGESIIDKSRCKAKELGPKKWSKAKHVGDVVAGVSEVTGSVKPVKDIALWCVQNMFN